eukprot:scaffold214991_cov10-Prasinocladus_malaysianus.AAC.1
MQTNKTQSTSSDWQANKGDSRSRIYSESVNSDPSTSSLIRTFIPRQPQSLVLGHLLGESALVSINMAGSTRGSKGETSGNGGYMTCIGSATPAAEHENDFRILPSTSDTR